MFIFLKTQRNIEIQNLEPKKMTQAYICMKISEYPPPPPGKPLGGGGLKALYWYQIYALDSAVVEVQEMFSSHGSLLIIAMYNYRETLVVMGGTLGTGTFKPEKNLVFFQDKKSRSP